MGTPVLGSKFLNATAVVAVANAFVSGQNIVQKGAGGGSSVTYRGIIGEPHLLTLSTDDTGGSSSGVPGSGPVQAASSTKLELIQRASHPNTGDPTYLLYVQATLAPLADRASAQSVLEELASANALGISDYTYQNVSGAPTWYWFGAIQNLSDLQALQDPVNKVKAKAGGQLQEFASLITSISSALMLKVQ